MGTTPRAASPAALAAEAPPTAAKNQEHGFRPDIQGLRAIAVLLVVVYHLFPSALPGGFAGVDVFFVISGYLITSHLWRTGQKSGRPGLADFWGRRARRLIPAAAVVLAVTWGVSYLVLPSSELSDTAAQIRASALYFQNWQLAGEAVNYLQSANPPTPVQHFWSLSVEEQFYLVWPLLFLVTALAARRARSMTRPVILGLTASLTAASFAYSVYETHANPAAAYFITPTRMWELGAGGLLALLPERITRAISRQGWLGWAGLVMIAASQFVLTGSTPFPGWIAILPVGGAVALIAGGSAQGRHGPARLTSVGLMTFLGGISYSLYLWHYPVIILWTAWHGHSPGVASGLLLGVASVVLAWLTKITVEDRVRLAPFIARNRWRSLSTALAAVLPVALVTAFLVAQPGAWNGHLGPDYPGAAALADKLASVPAEPVLPPPAHVGLPAYWAGGCLDAEHATALKTCYYGDTKNPTLKIALVGDSMAGNWWAPLEQIATQEHWELITELHATCAWTATQLTSPDGKTSYPTCHQWGATLLHDLVTTVRPDVVITSELAGQRSLAHPAGGPQASTDVGAGMATYWQQLLDHGIGVIAIQETPALHMNGPACVAKNGPSSQACAEPRSTAIRANSSITAADRDLGGKVPVIDMNSLICGPTQCPMVVGNVLVYMDGHHLTQSFAQTLAPFLRDKLTTVLAKTLPPAKRTAVH